MGQQITGHTQLVCLLGHPVSHSISPAMHNMAFSLCNLDYVYLAFDILPESLPGILESFKSMNVVGCNLTMPLKTAVLPYLDEISVAAELSNSVNTIVFKDNRLIGHTTDGIGYLDSLKNENADVKNATITLLGAGGAATSICTQAALDKAREIHIFKRKNATFNDAVRFAEKISKKTTCKVNVYEMEDKKMLQSCLEESSLLINATNVGMGKDIKSLVPKKFLRPTLFVSDIIYHPKMTPLLKDAKDVGCRYCNGMYMLLFQGAASFKLWTNTDMPVEEIKKALYQE